MNTQLMVVDAQAPDAGAIAQAAAVLRRGGLVAFPTETVYGLGANALDADAVARIFAAKGRAATNPLIVHVPDTAAALALVQRCPDSARRLTERFWPGPLTLVVRKSDAVPSIVTAGGATLALRVPAHPIALALLRACALPLAAPSANPSTRLSPTSAEHVRQGLEGRIDLILDGGSTPGGLESTVLDVTVTPPRLLRPGLVTPDQIEAVVGAVQAEETMPADSAPVRSPGLQERHYAPHTPLECSTLGRRRVDALRRQGLRVGWLTWEETSAASAPDLIVERLPPQPENYAANLYAALHRLDAAGVERIVVDLPPTGDAWYAVHDRLRRATHELS